MNDEFAVKGRDWQKVAARVEDGWKTIKGRKVSKRKSFAMVLRSQTKGRPSGGAKL